MAANCLTLDEGEAEGDEVGGSDEGVVGGRDLKSDRQRELFGVKTKAVDWIVQILWAWTGIQCQQQNTCL